MRFHVWLDTSANLIFLSCESTADHTKDINPISSRVGWSVEKFTCRLSLWWQHLPYLKHIVKGCDDSYVLSNWSTADILVGYVDRLNHSKGKGNCLIDISITWSGHGVVVLHMCCPHLNMAAMLVSYVRELNHLNSA